MNMVVLLLLLLALGYVAYIYYKLSNLANRQRAQESAIDAALKKRFDIFTRLIETFKDGMDVEKSSLRQVPLFREQALAAQKINDTKTRIGLEDQISQIAFGISFIFEQHLKIKEKAISHALHKELMLAERELARLQVTWNSLIDDYSKSNTGILPHLISKLFAKQLSINSEHWIINNEALEGREDYSVDMR